MTTKQESIKQIQEIKDLIVKGTAIIGKNEVIRALKNAQVSKILLAKNAPEEIVQDANYYAKLLGIEVNQLSQDNEELGIICKKNFFISIIGVSSNN